MTQYSVIELESVLEFVEHCLIALDVHQNVVCLVNFLDGIDQLPPAPVFYAMDLSLTAGYQRPIAFNHCRDLLALIGMDNKYDLKVPHAHISLWIDRLLATEKPPGSCHLFLQHPVRQGSAGLYRFFFPNQGG